MFQSIQVMITIEGPRLGINLGISSHKVSMLTITPTEKASPIMTVVLQLYDLFALSKRMLACIQTSTAGTCIFVCPIINNVPASWSVLFRKDIIGYSRP